MEDAIAWDLIQEEILETTLEKAITGIWAALNETLKIG
jgi:hypothetical protein